ncbi:hypothetical protein DYBT9275_00127 [Dyadobacter sp. CECT 9275]|uniref:PspC domain-containing protein n=1 Tax=Dyadobacter helix TaxID=2822344 RepID=A0A916J7D5_9BACT|nr:PspC domain-containing protein [Dyadobacter sp. CECT 9275]CAG4988638.1 hypothetical protein DYBT9275_00127 [Dyadobacter sp. CECT 9275]
MKKTISINIGGVIFHIEEDGYEKLKNYLTSIQRYFASFADSKEIVSDIEARVAERFWNKQKSDGKQVISLEDVEELITAMGTVADFEAIEQAEDILADPLETAREETFTAQEEPKAYSEPKAEAKKQPAASSRKLFRDLRRKLIGGVAAGLANYFTIDPIWVRLAFLFAVVGLPAGSGMLDFGNAGDLAGVSGFAVLIYIAMWIAFPGSLTLEEDATVKKFYRDPDRKVVSGVAAGVASYFGIDLGVVRFLWVLSILLFGTGVIIYIVLGVIAPSANTLTEKMEMQGEPITLSNIESNIKQSLDPDAKAGEEHIVSKILLLPFRAIALIIGALGKLLKGLGPVVRILIGVILVGFSSISLLTLVVGSAIALGLMNSVQFDNLPVPFMIFQELPGSLILSGILVAAIPLVFLLLLGLTLLSNKKIVSGTVWLTLAGLWIVGIIGATIGGVAYQRNFAKRGEVVQTTFYALPTGTLTLDHNGIYEEDNVDLDIFLEGYGSSDSIKLEKTLFSRGRSREEAEKMAQSIEYDITVNDSLFLFKEGPQRSAGRFREQNVDAKLFVPYNMPFVMTRNFYESMSRWGDNYQNIGKYDLENGELNWRNLRWVMRRDSGLICTNFPAKFLKHDEEQEDENYSYDGDDNGEIDLGERGTFMKQFPVGDFTKVDLGGAYSITLKHGTEYSVTADGDEKDVDDLKVKVDGGVLKVSRFSNFSLLEGSNKRIGFVITTPQLEAVSISGANKARIFGFKGLSKLDVDISGASQSEINVETDQLRAEISGASKVIFKGSARSATMDLSGACKVEATEMNIQNADVSASGASKVSLGRVNNIKKSENGASKIEVIE